MTGLMLEKLEALLGRVQRNAAAARSASSRHEHELSGESQDSFVELSDEALSSAEYADDEDILDLDAAELDASEEAAPVSSRRVATTMDEALAGAAERLETPKTIPPESGPEPRAAAELDPPPSRTPERPTTEQLGQTVALEEGPSAHFELDEPLIEPLDEPLSERGSDASQLEAELPSGADRYSEELASPPGAREELERVRLGEVQAVVISRPVISTNVVEFIEAHGRRGPQSFGAMLDETLSLAAR